METVLTFRTMNRGTWRETFGGISAFAKSAGWNLQQIDERDGGSDLDALYAFWNPAGIISSTSTEYFLGSSLTKLPAVFINTPCTKKWRRMASVTTRVEEIAQFAMRELLRLNPASLLYAGWFRNLTWVESRYDEAKKIARMHGLQMKAVLPAAAEHADTLWFMEHMAEALGALPKPIGVLAAADDVGALVLAAAARLGLTVPDDVAVVGVDDDPEICENCTPTLTSVHPDYHALGFTAAKTLQALMDGSSPPRSTIVPLVGLSRRASTVSMHRRDRKVAEALETIRIHACDGISAASVAAIFGTSLHTAESRFKAATGRTIGAEIMEHRFAAACAHLREKRSSIDAIANFCGWKTSSAFRMAFKARFGISPRAWAR